MKIAQVKKLPTVERWLYFIKEREHIRHSKEDDGGVLPPWTDDEILSKYRFCNVRRMDDKVSQWLLHHWYQPFKDHPNILLACALARFVNKIATLRWLSFPQKWQPETIKKRLRAYRDEGNTVFNGAYIVRGNDGMDKIECVVDYYVKPLMELCNYDFEHASMKEAWSVIKESYGMGSFMTGQIVADLRWAITGTWRDKKDWAPMGPGSKRGMNRLHGLPLNANMGQAHFDRELKNVIRVGNKELPTSITSRLEAIDWQNTLCEIDKYERALWGEGKPKQLYKPSKT